MVVFGSSLPSSTKTKKNLKIGPNLTNFSGSAHGNNATNVMLTHLYMRRSRNWRKGAGSRAQGYQAFFMLNSNEY